jgi:guanylate kinase
MKAFPNDFAFSVSHTTRVPREGEKEGVHYHFTSVEAIQTDIADGKFVEHAKVHSNYYGTSIEAVQKITNAGKVCVLDIDIQGAELVRATDLNPYFLFVEPPSMEILEQRLRDRNTETDETLQLRLGNAANELAYGKKEGNFDANILNNVLDEVKFPSFCPHANSLSLFYWAGWVPAC